MYAHIFIFRLAYVCTKLLLHCSYYCAHFVNNTG